MLLGKFRVSGHSMEPYLSSGDEVLAIGFFPIKKGDVVVFNHKSKIYVKRVRSRDKDLLELIGDNTNDSRDSRVFGKIKKNDIIGKVICKI